MTRSTEKLGLLFGLLTVLTWGPWGAWVDVPARAGFPETLGYVVWSLTMIPPALVALFLIDWKLEWNRRAVLLGCLTGFLGAGGQLLLFKVLRLAPAYLVFPFISLSPAATVLMAVLVGRERVSRKGAAGIALGLVAGVLLAWSKPSAEAAGSRLWIVLALLVLVAWGVQGYLLSRANRFVKAESIFFYMMATAIVLAPVSLAMTDRHAAINWSARTVGLTAAIQILNSVGALLIVYAFRFGKAMIVSPLINAGAPVVTVIVSLAMYGAMPLPVNVVGIVCAVAGTILMSFD